MARVIDRIRRRLRPLPPKPVILMYHRVADVRVDPWELAVRPRHFEAQLAVLRASRQPLAMSEFVERVRHGTLPRNAVAVTFDDGYVDTLREARPRLQAAGVPATLFLATAFVGQRTEYWWDELARIVLERSEALDDEVTIGGEPFRLTLSAADDPGGASAGWRAWNPPRNEREHLYYSLWRRLRELRAAERDAAMSGLREVLRPPSASTDSLPMNGEEVAELAGDRLFEIGGHTSTHPVLPSLTATERRRDILDGKNTCERLTSKPAIGFAYPHGANDPDSRAAVEECGFRWACSTESRPVAASEPDFYALPRIAVLDWDGPAFERALRSASA